MSRSPNPIDYATPTPGDRRPFTSIALTLILAIVAGIEVTIATFVLPRFARIFADFGTPLPGISVAFFSVMRPLGTPLGWLGAAALVFGLPILATRLCHHNCPIPTARVRLRVVALLIMLGLMLLIGVSVVAMFVPMVQLINSVNTKKP